MQLDVEVSPPAKWIKDLQLAHETSDSILQLTQTLVEWLLVKPITFCLVIFGQVINFRPFRQASDFWSSDFWSSLNFGQVIGFWPFFVKPLTFGLVTFGQVWIFVKSLTFGLLYVKPMTFGLVTFGQVIGFWPFLSSHWLLVQWLLVKSEFWSSHRQIDRQTESDA